MSDDSNVATVDQTGLVTAVGTGNCRITAYDKLDGYLKSNLDITVEAENTNSDVLFVWGESDATMVEVGDALRLFVSKNGESYSDVTYAIDNTDLADISEDGVLTGKVEGTVLVTVTDKADASVTTSKSFEVVYELPIEAIVVHGAGDVNTITEIAGQLQMVVQALPSGELYNDVEFSVDDETIAEIGWTSGLLTALSNGTVVVTATSTKNANLTDTCEIVISNQGDESDETTYTEDDLYNSMSVSFLDADGNTVNTLDGQSYDINLAFNADIESQFNVTRAYINTYNNSSDIINNYDYFNNDNMVKTSDGETVNCKSNAQNFVLDKELGSISITLYADGAMMSTTKSFTAVELGLGGAPGEYTIADLIKSMTFKVIDSEGNQVTELDGQSYDVDMAFDNDIASNFEITQVNIIVRGNDGSKIDEPTYLIGISMIGTVDENNVIHYKSNTAAFNLSTELNNITVMLTNNDEYNFASKKLYIRGYGFN